MDTQIYTLGENFTKNRINSAKTIYECYQKSGKSNGSGGLDSITTYPLFECERIIYARPH